ncbi:hypothetical protein BJY52DRAFT_1274957 [Lactarius psammicola]|nr:hypothetical protein BJY52DRAFT_1274957 [Lactarius psammicola]
MIALMIAVVLNVLFYPIVVTGLTRCLLPELLFPSHRASLQQLSEVGLLFIAVFFWLSTDSVCSGMH